MMEKDVMKRLFSILIFVSIAFTLDGCGGGGSPTVTLSPKTAVTVTIGQTRTASRTGARPANDSPVIPSGIVTIRVAISATDMTTIERVISVSGKTGFSETFDVPNGANRHFLVEARDASLNILYKGETFADLTGQPLSLSITMISTDQEPPVFSGLAGIDTVTTTTMRLFWQPATDNVTPSSEIQYLIYVATTAGGENLASPSFTTPRGATSFILTGLNPNTLYFIVVRAMDERGNIDTNTVEKSAKTLAPPDVQQPQFGGAVSAIAVSETEIDLFWTPSFDDVSPSTKIVYLIYMSLASGMENFAIPSFITPPGATSFRVPGLSPNTTYFFVVRARDEAGNTDTNAVEVFATTLSANYIDLSIGNALNDGTDITFSVVNNGSLEAQNVLTFVIYADPYFSNCDTFVMTLPAGGSVSGAVMDVSATTFRIIVDPLDAVPESDETNNTACGGLFCTSPPPLSLCTGGGG